MAELIEADVQPVADDAPVTRELLEKVQTALDESRHAEARDLTVDLLPADLADLIENLRPEHRTLLIEVQGKSFEGETLAELDETVRDQVMEDLPNETIAEVIADLNTDDAVHLIEDLEKSEQSDILAQVPREDRLAVERNLEYPEDSAGRLMSSELIAIPPFWSVGQTIDYIRDTDNLPDQFSEIFVVDPGHHLLGAVSLNRFLRAKREVKIDDLTEETMHPVQVEDDQEEVARVFERYDLMSTAVIDDDQRLVGVITIDDVVDVIQEEAEEDILRMGGVASAESVADTIMSTAKNRFLWLAVNLLTAIIASVVIAQFDATIQQMVALAVLMPIVASMGGNAATQTMTVAVRGIATKELNVLNATRIVTRETAVGIINGLLFALILGIVTVLWFGNSTLGYIIAIAMIINMFAAALAGILIPILLDKLGVDPAIASSVFVTTVTDVVGFFAFLGIAALWFG